jgi:hypothetical protein
LDQGGNVLHLGYCRTDKQSDPFSKLEVLTRYVIRAVDDAGTTGELEVYVEEALKRFRRGMSSAGTIFKLAQFNGMVQLACYYHLGVVPKMIAATEARKSLGLKVLKESKCGITTKDQVARFVQSRLGIEFEPKVMKSGPRKGQAVFDERNYDAADAYVIAESGRLSG